AYLPLDLARLLADVFALRGIPAADVLALAGVDAGPPSAPAAAPSPATLSATGPLPPGFLPRPLEIPAGPLRALPGMGAVRGGAEGFYFNEGEAKEYIVRPPSLAGVSNAFALYVDGESMEPRYYAGETLYVNPNRPLTRGCFVAVELADGQCLIKQFLRRNDDHLVLAQFNPPKEIRLPTTTANPLYP